MNKKQRATAKKETNLQNVSLSIISTNESNDKKISEYLKGELEKIYLV